MSEGGLPPIFTITNVADGEFQLRVEEEKRDCLPCIFLALQDKEGKQYPAIMLRDRIKNKKAYTDTISDSWWILLQEKSNIRKLVILKLDFRGAGKMKFCLDFSPGIHNKENREDLKIWLQYLILSDGKVAIIDGDGTAIVATGIQLELPWRILTGGL